jgi:hypothetical protein
MKNNKGRYNWIHSLNEAGLQAQQNGFNMLNEVTAKKITDPAKQARLMAQMPKNPVINPESPSAHPADVMDAISRLGPSSPGTIKLADGDVGAYVNLRRMKQAERMAHMARSNGPINAKPAGDAQAVEDDGQDLEIADPDTKMPSYPIAAQARAETDDEAAFDFEEEMRKAGHGNLSRGAGRHPYTPTSEELPESVSQKIGRILRN